MLWIYILKCENGYYYIGQTSRLYNRCWEHQHEKGGLNTLTFIPEEIVAIYKVNTIGKFIDYNEKICNINDNKDIEWTYNTGFNNPKHILNNWNSCEYENNFESENFIAECMMIHDKNNWKKIRGGKYIRFDIEYNYPDNIFIKNLPICKCGLPCDVKKNEEKEYLFFRCAKKNMWDIFKEKFEIENKPCNFYMEYIKDKQLKQKSQIKLQSSKLILKELFKKAFWLKNVEIENSENKKCISCAKLNYSKIIYPYKEQTIRNLCFDCFINKNEELSQIYEKNEQISDWYD